MSAYSDLILAETSLQSYWRFGEASGHFVDSKGSVNSTNESSINYAANSLLISDTTNKCLDVNEGTVTFSDTYDFTGVLPFSIESWLNVTTTPTSGNNGIPAKYDDSNDKGWRLRIDSDGQVKFQRGDGSVDTAKSAVASNIVYHVVGTFDGSSMKLYVNGDLKQTTPSTRSLPDLTEQIKLKAVKAKVDEMAIYNTALDADAVSRHYQFGANEFSNHLRRIL